jgi:hypothetical protein
MVLRGDWCPGSGQKLEYLLEDVTIYCPECSRRVAVTELNHIIMRHKQPIQHFPNREPYELIYTESNV